MPDATDFGSDNRIADAHVGDTAAHDVIKSYGIPPREVLPALLGAVERMVNTLQRAQTSSAVDAALRRERQAQIDARDVARDAQIARLERTLFRLWMLQLVLVACLLALIWMMVHPS